MRLNDEIYIYPENSESGLLKLYRLDVESHSLTEVGILSDSPLTDATIYPVEVNGSYYMISTKAPDSQNNTILLNAAKVNGLYKQVGNQAVISTKSEARCGGNFFGCSGTYYRPVQNCEKRYGGSLKIMEVKHIGNNGYKETQVCELKPTSWKYNLGLHTLNFNESHDLVVIDGYGYLYP